MDQIVKALGLINSFQINGLHGEANPTSGARLNLTVSIAVLPALALAITSPRMLNEAEVASRPPRAACSLF